MKKKSLKTKISNYLTAFLITQCAVTIIALPICVSWGLPLSLASFLGNFIFSPILALFLIISSLVFFTTLLNIPNGILCAALECLYTGWEWLLKCGSKAWLVGFIQPPTWFIIGILGITFYTIRRQYLIDNYSRLSIITTAMFFNIFCFWGYTFYKQPATVQTECISNKKGSLLIMHHPNKTLSLIDYGYFKGILSPDKIVTYELKSYFLKKYGTLTIKDLHFNAASSSNFQAAQGLCTIGTIEKLKMPYFSHTLTKSGWRSYFSLKRTLENLKVPCKRFSHNGKFVILKSKKPAPFQPDKKNLKIP